MRARSPNIASLFAGAVAAVFVCGSVLAQDKAAAPAAPAPKGPPGFSAMDKSNEAKSKQDVKLKPHATPPIAAAADKLPVAKLKVPAGFKVELYSSGHAAGRTMVMGDKGTIFMGTRVIGRVYAVTAKKEVKTIAQGLTQPNGLAFKDGSLYVFAINKVYRYDKIEDNLDNPPAPVELTEAYGLPDTIHHNWKYVDFGPDGKMYVQVGANYNICELNPGTHAQIRRYNADGSGREIVARGVRNTVGFDWHPVSKELWFTDNGRDWAGDAGPEDELNRITKATEGANYGFPYCHARGVVDPDISIPNACAGVVMPAALLGAHTAALGIKFYTGKMFPANYQNVAFIARRGSWNKTQKTGYDVIVARTQPNGTATIEPFLSGFLDEKTNEFVGRPTYVLPMRDGSLLVSDEQNGAIYRVSYGR